MRRIPTSIVLATDPGLASLGYLLARLYASKGLPPEVEIFAAGVWKAELPEEDAREQSAVEDSFRRTQTQMQNVHRVVEEYGVSILVTEALSHPRDAGSAAKVSMVWGGLATLVYMLGLHVEMVRPQDVRRLLGLPKTTKTATRKDKKKLVIDELERRYGKDGIKALVGHLTRAEERTHPLDALAAFTAVMIQQFGSCVVIRIVA